MITLSDLILELNKAFEENALNFDLVKSLMTNYNSNREEWEQYAMFSSDSYTRNLVHEGNGKFNLVVLCWEKNQGSRIHSHAKSHCFMKVLEGKIHEERYDWPPKEQKSASECGQNELVCKTSSIFNRNDLIYICGKQVLEVSIFHPWFR
ncbi:hypothetical protein CHS0354_005479 [Potamilus streckersoni]|uniref:Cysteine dioxygenase n=1 Tax=Potamilus streckersoni TaxID=2493646 RepID=A0AAE0SGK7_9BIVA|nr:hypothetical protein CHS0354_005479 [Potamilus streckersoni]